MVFFGGTFRHSSSEKKCFFVFLDKSYFESEKSRISVSSLKNKGKTKKLPGSIEVEAKKTWGTFFKSSRLFLVNKHASIYALT